MTESRSFEEVLKRDGQLAYTNKGASMMPLLREDRDVMIIRQKGPEPLKRLDVVLFRRPGVTGRGAYVLHRILKVNGDGTYWIVGDNCVKGETVKEAQIIGVLSAVNRGGKIVSVTGRGYLLYSHLWCDWVQGRFFALRARMLAGRCARGLKRRLTGIRRGGT